nr:MAG TPA: hypothetical protein [Caudoviricetes sp.]
MAKTIATDGHVSVETSISADEKTSETTILVRFEHGMSYDDKTKFVGKIHNIVMEEN